MMLSCKTVTGQGSRWGYRDPNNQFIMWGDFSIKNSSISQKQIILQVSTVPLTANWNTDQFPKKLNCIHLTPPWKYQVFWSSDFPWGIPCISKYGNIPDNKTWTLLKSSHIKLITHDQYKSNLQPVIRLALLKPIHLYLLNKYYLKKLISIFLKKYIPYFFLSSSLTFFHYAQTLTTVTKNITQLTWISKHASLFSKNI